MKFAAFLLLSVVAVSLGADTHKDLHCFVCNSYQDSSCSDEFSSDSKAMTDAFLQLCPIKEVEGNLTKPFCRKNKIWFEVNGEVRIHRDCGYLRREEYPLCYQQRADDHIMDVCQCDDVDGCNSAPQHVSGSAALLFAAVTAVFARGL